MTATACERPSLTRTRLRSFPTTPPEPENTGSTSTSTPSVTSSNAASPGSSSSAASPPASRKPHGTTSPSSPWQQQSYGSNKCPHFLDGKVAAQFGACGGIRL